MAHNDMHLDAMLRHLGAAYYDSTQGRATRADVTRALSTVAEQLDEQPAVHGSGRSAAAPRAEHHAGGRGTRKWARQVEDVMTTSVVTVDRITPYKEVARLLTEHKISGLPVLSLGRQVAGVMTEADLLVLEEQTAQRALRSGSHGPRWRVRREHHPVLTAGQLMTAPAITIHPEAPIPSAARLMNTHHVMMLPVVDKQGKLAGVVSRRDLLSVFLRPDSEIADDVRQVVGEVFGTDAADVAALVRNGIVTLTITPESGTARHEDFLPVACRLIWDIDGVVDVVTRLHSHV
jgi:CBS-domain-containing membrane protein